MFNALRKFFTRHDSQAEELKNKVKMLETKLAERQEVINKTNAYWKKKLRESTRRS